MQVSSTGSTTPSTSTTSSTAAATSATAAATNMVDYNSFLKLLVEQLKDQDPTAPSDPTAFMSQLASFSSVEQQVQSNTKLDQLLTTNSLSQAETIIGKTVTDFDRHHVRQGRVRGRRLGRDGDRHADQWRDPDPRKRRLGQRLVNEADALNLVQATIWTIAVTSGPAILTAMIVGIVVALFQALTQVQEMTLTFVPKIVAVLLVLGLTASFIGSQLFIFTEQVYARIEKGN